MNALLVKLVQIVFTGCGAILCLYAMDVGANNGHFFVPGIALLVLAIFLFTMQRTDKAWAQEIDTFWQFLTSCAGWFLVWGGCWGVIGAVGDFFREAEPGFGWFWSVLRVFLGLFVARIGVSVKAEN